MSKEKPICSKHKTPLGFDPDEGWQCLLCINEAFDSEVSKFHCSHCGKKGNHTSGDCDEYYWELYCDCGNTTRAYVSYDDGGYDDYEPCDGCKNTPSGAPRALCQGGGCRG